MKNPEIDKHGHKFWHNEKGQFHRLDGPAKEFVNGDKLWFIDDKLHRIDGPACEWYDGDKEWRVNGELHRLDGPAIEFTSDDISWWVNGIKLSGPLELLNHGAKLEDLAEWLTPREIALCRTQK